MENLVATIFVGTDENDGRKGYQYDYYVELA